MGMSLYIDREHMDTGYEEATAQSDHHYRNDRDIGEMVAMVLMKPSKIQKARSYDANTSRFCEIYTTKMQKPE